MSVLDTFSLKGKVALMTGGAELYGRQIVAALAEAGATTIIASRDVPALEQVAAEHRARGCDVSALPLDQGEEQSILALRDEIKKKMGTAGRAREQRRFPTHERRLPGGQRRRHVRREHASERNRAVIEHP